MTHPPTETQRKALYAAFSALSRESRVRTKPRPSKGRESAPNRESGASSLGHPILDQLSQELQAQAEQALKSCNGAKVIFTRLALDQIQYRIEVLREVCGKI